MISSAWFFGFVGKELEESGVLSESLRSRKDFWGLHMPLVCPDGAVVAYAWKRQLAGQAGASAVDRTRFVSVKSLLLQFCMPFEFPCLDNEIEWKTMDSNSNVFWLFGGGVLNIGKTAQRMMVSGILRPVIFSF